MHNEEQTCHSGLGIVVRGLFWDACKHIELRTFALHAYTRFSHYRVAPGDRIRRPEQPN